MLLSEDFSGEATICSVCFKRVAVNIPRDFCTEGECKCHTILILTTQGEEATMEQGRIENGFYVQGDVKFAVDTKNAHKTFDAVAALSNVDKIKLAKLNEIPAEPFNKQSLTTILKSVVQNAWFVATTGNLPTEVVSGHQVRLSQYKAVLTIPTSGVDFLNRRKTRAESKTRPSLMYLLDGAKYEATYNVDHNGWRGQRYLVINTMLELQKQPRDAGKGITVREIFDNTKETRETSAPTRNAVGQIVNALVAAGLASLLNPQDVRTPKTPPAKTPEAPNKQAPPTPPAKKKKKH